MTLGNGAIISDSTKQKVNARSSTESEMIAVDNTLSKVLWTIFFNWISRSQDQQEYYISRQHKRNKIETK